MKCSTRMLLCSSLALAACGDLPAFSCTDGAVVCRDLHGCLDGVCQPSFAAPTFAAPREGERVASPVSVIAEIAETGVEAPAGPPRAIELRARSETGEERTALLAQVGGTLRYQGLLPLPAGRCEITLRLPDLDLASAPLTIAVEGAEATAFNAAALDFKIKKTPNFSFQ